MPPNGFEHLGRLARRFFLDFVNAPAATLHADWRAVLLPWWVEGSRLERYPAALSMGLLSALDVDHDLSRFRFDDPACQAALLPPDDLLALARQFGLALHAPELVRVIRGDDLAALAPWLSERDWQFIVSLGPAGWPARPVPLGPLDGAVERLLHDGLVALLGVLGRLPKNIAQRALIKLPRSEERMSERQLSQAAYLFPVVYRSFVASASDRWHALWTMTPTEA